MSLILPVHITKQNVCYEKKCISRYSGRGVLHVPEQIPMVFLWMHFRLNSFMHALHKIQRRNILTVCRITEKQNKRLQAIKL